MVPFWGPEYPGEEVSQFPKGRNNDWIQTQDYLSDYLTSGLLFVSGIHSTRGTVQDGGHPVPHHVGDDGGVLSPGCLPSPPRGA